MEKYKKRKMVFFYLSANLTIFGKFNFYHIVIFIVCAARLVFFNDVWLDYPDPLYLFLASFPIYTYLLCGLSYQLFAQECMLMARRIAR